MPFEHYIPFAYVGQKFSDKQKQAILNEALHEFATMGRVHQVKELIELGADVNYISRDYKGQSLGSVLDSAISGSYPLPNPQVVQMLLDSGARITATEQRAGYTTVMGACYHAAQAEQALMEPLALIDSTSEQLMAKAKACRAVASLVISRAAKEDLRGISDEGKTALDYAASSSVVTAMLQEAMQKHGLTSLVPAKPSAAKPRPPQPKGP